ncbi:translation initiation factor IF-2 [Streptomyces sp. NPDC037389]|uniref:translation initiation factor IF-2 n=1 Tax=Streptomyces sp. NPDC037389 TaxID=3155369 RepID=UPI0033E74FB6
MTATMTSTAPVARGPARARGLAWLVLRRHRTTARVALALLIALVAELVWLRLAMTGHLDAHPGLRTACRPGTGGSDCADGLLAQVDRFRSTYGDYLHYNGQLLEFLPLLTGLFVAGPMVARELESGTHRLVWAQSVPPVRWLAAKLAVPVVAVLAGVSALAAVYTWTWSAAPAGLLPGQRWDRSFDMIGPAPVAHALLAIAVGALVGLLIKRTVPAMGATLIALGALWGQLESLRPRLIGPATQLSAAAPGLIRGDEDWIVEHGMVTKTGGRIPDPRCGVGVGPDDCVAQHHAAGWYVDWHPGSHLWPLEWAEAGVAVGLAALAAGAAFWVIRRTYP